MAKQYETLPRRKVRYWLFRFRTEAEGGPKATGAPRGMRKYFEEQEGFGGWIDFAVTWDVNPEEPLQIVPRRFSVWEEWDATLNMVLRDMPGVDTSGSEADVL